MTPPHFSPNLPTGILIWTNLNLPWFNTNFSFSGWLVSEKKFLKSFSLYSHLKIWPLPCIVALPYPQKSWNIQTCSLSTSIYTTWRCPYHFQFFWLILCYLRRFLKMYSIFPSKKLTTYYCPTLQLGIMIWTNLSVPYLRMFSHQLQIFWLIIFWGKDF